jgi:preprotein translocase subunit SecA
MQNQLFEMVQDNPELMEKLKQASKQFWWRVPVQISKKDGKVIIQTWKNTPSQTNNDSRKMLFEDEDGIEVFEADDINQKNISEWVILPTRKKVRPNDPCPCGSGKKYKKCHWISEEK